MAIGTYSIGEVAIGELPSGPVTIDVPVARAVAVSIVPPLLDEGVLVDAPSMVIGVTGASPQILQSANILVPTTPVVGVTIDAPAIGAGAIVEAGGYHSDTYYAGGIGDSSVGEFSVGDGPPLTYTYTQPSRIGIRILAPADVQTGKLNDIPVMSIAMLTKVPEIESRRRKLKILTIPC